MTPEDIQSALTQAAEDADELLEAVVEAYAPDGVSFDQEKLTDADFLAFYIDLHHRPAEPPFSVMDYLPTIAPKLAQTMRTRYDRIRMEASR